MNLKHIFRIYTAFWLIAVIIFSLFLQKNEDNVAITNYTGVIRGATQKLMKKEICEQPDDALIANLDAILDELQTGEGDLGLTYYDDEIVQGQLAELEVIWSDIKETIYLLRTDKSYQDKLYELSENHFVLANEIVFNIQNGSDVKTSQCIVIFITGTILYMGIFLFIYEHHHKLTKQMLTMDNQTKLFNRRGLEEQVKKLLHQNPQSQYCMIKFDIDNFKLINTSYGYGYGYGDELILLIAKALSQRKNTQFIPAHLEADNFIVVTKYSDFVLDAINNILSNAVQGYDVSLLFPKVEFSCGAYKIEDNNESVKDMVSKVIMAHKAVKSSITNVSSWYNQDLLSSIQKENEYCVGIDLAIKNHELKMYLQPQIDLKTSKVMGAESLVRWQPDNGGIVYPDQFIPILERKGLMFKLDYYMLEQACIFLAKQKSLGNSLFKIAVNISRVTLSRDNFMDKVIEIVNKYDTPYKFIEIEVTESSLNNLSEDSINILTELGKMGFIIAMDDFGAGYSSLSSLRTLPVQIVKLDRQFLSGMDTDEKMKQIITSVVDMIHNIGMKVICEGVEQQSHVELLSSIGCEYGQGYFWAKPMPSKEFGKYIIKND